MTGSNNNPNDRNRINPKKKNKKDRKNDKTHRKVQYRDVYENQS